MLWLYAAEYPALSAGSRQDLCLSALKSERTAHTALKPLVEASTLDAVPQEAASPVVGTDCDKVGAKRRRSKAEILANPKRHHPDAAENGACSSMQMGMACVVPK